METFYVPKPEWYFLFFYQTLKVFHGGFEPIGTVGIPLIVTLLLIFLPFFDRSPERNPSRRRAAMVCYAIFVAWVITMAVIGYYSHPGIASGGTAKVSTASSQASKISSGDPTAQVSASEKQGEQLFNSLGCIGCHTIKGRGGVVGPALTRQLLQGKTRQWLMAQVRNPRSHNPSTIMPAFSSATDQQVNDVVDFLLSVAQGKPVIRGPVAKAPPAANKVPVPPAAPSPAEVIGPHGPPEAASFIIGNVELGATSFHQNCEPCHGPQGKDKVPNPGSTDGTVPPLNSIDSSLFSKNAQTFVNTIDPYIQHGSIPDGPNPALRMLPFGDSESLTQQMIANVEAYVLDLNNVNRAQILHPGLQPHSFFWLVLVAFAIIIGGLGISLARKNVETGRTKFS